MRFPVIRVDLIVMIVDRETFQVKCQILNCSRYAHPITSPKSGLILAAVPEAARRPPLRYRRKRARSAAAVCLRTQTNTLTKSDVTQANRRGEWGQAASDKQRHSCGPR
jgi:hypothetical protein